MTSNFSINQNQTQIETYMLNKMEEKLNHIQKSRHLVMNINSLEELQFHKSRIVQNFFDVEDDMRETFQLAKSTLSQNRELVERIEFEESVNRDFERKIENQDREIEEMKEDLINLTKQLHLMEDRQRGDEEYIRELEKRLMKAEMGDTKNEELKNEINYNTNTSNNNINYTNAGLNASLNISGNNTSMSNITATKKKEEILNDSFYNQNNFNSNNQIIKNSFNNTIKSNNDINLNNINTTSNLNNYSDLISERENGKKLINEYVNDHLNNENISPNKNLDREIYSNEKNESLSKSPNQTAKTTKLKANRVTDILVKLNSNSDFHSIITKLFGDDILNQLMSPNVDEEFLVRIEETILEIEKLRENDLKEEEILSKSQNDQEQEYLNYPQPYPNQGKHVSVIEEEFEEENPNSPNSLNYNYTTNNQAPLYYENNQVNHSYNQPPLYNQNEEFTNKSYDILKENNLSKSRMNKSSLSNTKSSYTARKKQSFEENNFENSLRSYYKTKNKVFKNYTRPYGDFFDAPLQKGGQTKFNDSKKTRSKSKTKKLYEGLHSNFPYSNSILAYKFSD